MNFTDYLKIKRAEGRKVSYELTYVDMVRDLKAGLLLSQIMYWFTPDEQGRHKTRATYKGRRAIAKARSDWFEEIRMTEKEYDSAIKVLIHYKIVDVVNSMFNGKRTPFIMINEEQFMSLYCDSTGIDSVLLKREHRYKQKGKTDIAKLVRPLTDITTENTTKITSIGKFDKQISAYSFNKIKNKIDIENNTIYYIECFLKNNGDEHYKTETWLEIIENLSYMKHLNEDEIIEIVEKYLNTNFKAHSLYHSSLENVLTHRMQEVGLLEYVD